MLPTRVRLSRGPGHPPETCLDLPVDTAPGTWSAHVRWTDLLGGTDAPGRWQVHLLLDGMDPVRVGRPLSDLADLPQAYRFPWIEVRARRVRPQFTVSRRLELAVR